MIVLQPTRKELVPTHESHSPAREEKVESTLSPSEKPLKTREIDDVESFTQISDSGGSLEGTNMLLANSSSPFPPHGVSPKQHNQMLIVSQLDAAIAKKLPSVLRDILSKHPEFEMQPSIYRDSFHAGKEIFAVFLEFQPDLLDKHYTIGHLGQVLGVAVLYNDIEYTRFLLEKGADPNRSYAIGGSSALKTAINWEVDPEIVRLLKEYGATMKGNGNLG